MNTTKKIKRISIIGLLILCIIGLGVHYFSNRTRRALEKQIIAMDGMGINIDFNNAEIIYNGIDSVYSSSKVKKLILFVDSTSCPVAS